MLFILVVCSSDGGSGIMVTNVGKQERDPKRLKRLKRGGRRKRRDDCFERAYGN